MKLGENCLYIGGVDTSLVAVSIGIFKLVEDYDLQ